MTLSRSWVLPAAESLRCFRGWSGRCRLSFRHQASCGSTNDALTRYLRHSARLAFCSRMRCCLTISALGRIYCWPYLPACRVPPDDMRWKVLSHALTWPVFILAIRRRSPADNARVSPCSARYWLSPRHCYLMNPLVGWMRRYATPFANGSSPRCVS